MSSEFTLTVPKTRSRANTESQALPITTTGTTETPYPYKPSAEASAYTDKRVEESLSFARKQLSRRDFSPRTQTFWTIFVGALNDRTQAQSHDEIIETTAGIRTCEFLIQDIAWLRPDQNKEFLDLQNRLLALRELEYYARYGDYLKIIPTRIRLFSSDKKIDDWNLLSGSFQWSDISESLAREAPLVGKPGADIRTQSAVHQACSALGINTNESISLIHEYGKRNSLMHCNLEALKSSGDLFALAQTLHKDYKDVDQIFPESGEVTNKETLKDLIMGEIESTFNTSRGFNNYRLWHPLPEFLARLDEEQKDQAKPSKAEVKLDNIAKDKLRKEEKAARQKEASLMGPKGQNKRLASTAEPRGDERDNVVKRQAKLENLLKKKTGLEVNLENMEREIAQLKDDIRESQRIH